MLRISFKNRLGEKSQLLTFINNNQLKTLIGKKLQYQQNVNNLRKHTHKLRLGQHFILQT